MEKYQCDRCESTEIFLRKKGNATGLYCLSCGKWYKWVGKKDVKQFIHRGFKVYSEDYVPQVSAPTAPTVTPETEYYNEVMGYSNTNMGVATPPRPPKQEAPPFLEEDNYIADQHTPKQEKDDSEPCRTCITGVIDPLASSFDVCLSITDGIMNLRTKDRSELYGSFKIDYCPSCGRKVQ